VCRIRHQMLMLAPRSGLNAAARTPAKLRLTAESAAERLARLGRWCLDGRMAAAEMELFEWRRDPQCPASARLLLAAIEARRGGDDEAIDTLWAAINSMQADDFSNAGVRQLLIALLMSRDADDAARGQAQELQQSGAHDPAAAQWLAAVSPLNQEQLAAPVAVHAELLARELCDAIGVTASMVVALRIAPEPADVSLLRAALALLPERIGANHDHQLIVAQAASELALMAGDHEDARRWAHRGLALHPYYAPLALVLARVADDPSAGPGALRVLRGAVEAHPRYADLRAALIRRARAEGKREMAASQLRLWMIDEPNHPLAQRLQSEIAA